MAECVERPSRCLINPGIRTHYFEPKQWRKNWYLVIRSQAFSIVWIPQGLIGSVSGYCVMVLMTWTLSGAALIICVHAWYACTLSHIGTRPDVTLDVTRTWNSNNQLIWPPLAMLLLSRQDYRLHRHHTVIVPITLTGLWLLSQGQKHCAWQRDWCHVMASLRVSGGLVGFPA